MEKAVRFLFLSLFFCMLPTAAVARNYHVSPSGDDSGAGTQGQPWRTLERVSRAELEPGDRVLLEGGKLIRGSLLLDAADSGMPGQAVLIMSHGRGRATIDAGDGAAIHVKSSSNV
ncbi:MAG: hypothetical protein EHM18_11030, partial [Acidobacteria bacterium]